MGEELTVAPGDGPVDPCAEVLTVKEAQLDEMDQVAFYDLVHFVCHLATGHEPPDIHEAWGSEVQDDGSTVEWRLRWTTRGQSVDDPPSG